MLLMHVHAVIFTML